MDLVTKSREELLELAGKLNLKVPNNITDETLRGKIETEAIRKTVEIEERERMRLQAESKMKIDIAAIVAESEIRGIKVDIPKEPTIVDIVRLQKQLLMTVKEPKPSPETLAIEASEKVYAVFLNMEQGDMNVPFNVGGKYWFHLWPEKVHVLPRWLIGYLRKKASTPIYGRVKVKDLMSADIDDVIERSVRKGVKPRFRFEILGDAPQNAKFGVVLDDKILKKLLPELQPV